MSVPSMRAKQRCEMAGVRFKVNNSHLKQFLALVRRPSDARRADTKRGLVFPDGSYGGIGELSAKAARIVLSPVLIRHGPFKF
jgi:hypothetical protein